MFRVRALAVVRASTASVKPQTRVPTRGRARAQSGAAQPPPPSSPTEGTQEASSNLKPEAPRIPEEYECCGNECGTDCVWHLYFEDQKRYTAEIREWRKHRTTD